MGKVACFSVCVVLCVVAGCSAPPEPTPSPSVTVVGTGPAYPSSASAAPRMCPGTPGTPETVCTPEQLAELSAKADLYVEAEQVFRRYFEETGKVAVRGGEASPEVLALMAGAAADSYRQQRQHLVGVTASAPGEIRYVRPAPGQSYKGSDVALSVCADGAGSVMYKGGKEIGPMGGLQSTYFLKREGSLKIWWQRFVRLSSC